jgi:hypothetical protein
MYIVDMDNKEKMKKVIKEIQRRYTNPTPHCCHCDKILSREVVRECWVVEEYSGSCHLKTYDELTQNTMDRMGRPI